MEPIAPDMRRLFAQLGESAEDAAINRFIDRHILQGNATALHEASWWSKSQSDFLHQASELTDESGGRHYNKSLEDEAACLSGVLLVPKAAAIAVVASKKHPLIAANEFNISLQMMNMRLNQSGAKRIMGYGRS